MEFNSYKFVLLWLCSLLFYWIAARQSQRRLILFATSCVFYVTWNYYLAALLLLIALITWFTSKKIYIRSFQSDRPLILGASVALVASNLIYFKYSNFICSQLFSSNSCSAQNWLPKLLPLGISFYTFQLIAYLVDCARRKIEPEKSPIDVILLVSYFPHLIAGPICRSYQLIPQFKNERKFQFNFLSDALVTFLCGYALKTGIADGFALFANKIFQDHQQFNPVDLFLGVLSFAFQIYCDFWGYSLMALGVSISFGIKLPYNFDQPYSAANITDFWRRWHMTLSNWLRDYVYIPLGGNRKGIVRGYINLILTMLIGGIWHGANWTFLFWGFLNGMGLAAHKLISNKIKIPIPTFLATLFTFSFVLITWVFFRADNISIALDILKQITDVKKFSLSSQVLSVEYIEILLLFFACYWSAHDLTYPHFFSETNSTMKHLKLLVIIAIALIYRFDPVAFIYFQF